MFRRKLFVALVVLLLGAILVISGCMQITGPGVEDAKYKPTQYGSLLKN